MNIIRGKIIIITGASSGIGAATARELARHGATLVLAARRRADLERLATEIEMLGATALPVRIDVTEPADLARLVTTTLEHFGRIDVLFNNAGIGEPGPFLTADDAAIQHLVATNLLAPIRLTRAVVPQMLRQGRGQIIITGSVASHIASPGLYSTTKFAMRGFADSLRRELHGTGIDVSLVSPGLIRTGMTADMAIPMPGPQIVARAVVRLIHRPRREVIVPGFYLPAIWLTRLFPALTDLIVSRRRPRGRPAGSFATTPLVIDEPTRKE